MELRKWRSCFDSNSHNGLIPSTCNFLFHVGEVENVFLFCFTDKCSLKNSHANFCSFSWSDASAANTRGNGAFKFLAQILQRNWSRLTNQLAIPSSTANFSVKCCQRYSSIQAYFKDCYDFEQQTKKVVLDNLRINSRSVFHFFEREHKQFQKYCSKFLTPSKNPSSKSQSWFFFYHLVYYWA